MDSCAGSLEYTWWDYSMSLSRYNHINLTGLEGLQFLTLVGQMTDFRVWEWGFRVADVLQDLCQAVFERADNRVQLYPSTPFDWRFLSSKI